MIYCRLQTAEKLSSSSIFDKETTRVCEAVCFSNLTEAGAICRLLHLPHHRLACSGTSAALLSPLFSLLPELLQTGVALLFSLIWGGREQSRQLMSVEKLGEDKMSYSKLPAPHLIATKINSRVKVEDHGAKAITVKLYELYK